jgi:hypothetical protein
MGKDVDVGIPQPFVTISSMNGALDLDLDEIRIKEIPVIRMDNTIKGDSNNPVVLNSNNTVDLGLDNIQITKLPQINLQLSTKPTRVHFPVNYKLGFGTMGMEIFSMNLCGESMVVIEDYIPHSTEECK